MVFAITLIPILGKVLAYLIGAKAGVILTGFFGGLISSTATTASLARKSINSKEDEHSSDFVIFLSATTAMLIEGLFFLLMMGKDEFHFQLTLIFIGPLIISSIMIYLQSRHIPAKNSNLTAPKFEILPILKLSAFIIVILALSKALQNFFGQSGLLLFTFLVSLFEIHGSIIANIQLHQASAIDVKLLGGLLSLSIVASYLSKFFLISRLGSKVLKMQSLKATFWLFTSLGVSWLLFIFSL
jgi:uncharacterized membrane protein (DUF4010 family)